MPDMEQMNAITSGSVQVNSWWVGEGAGSYPLPSVVGGSCVYLAGISHAETNLSKIT